MRQCVQCLETMELELFVKNNTYKDGRSNMCKNCYNIIYNRREGTRRENPSYNNGAIKKLESEKLLSEHLLIKLGYDLNSNLSIHEQFLIRHNLVD